MEMETNLTLGDGRTTQYADDVSLSDTRNLHDFVN